MSLETELSPWLAIAAAVLAGGALGWGVMRLMASRMARPHALVKTMARAPAFGDSHESQPATTPGSHHLVGEDFVDTVLRPAFASAAPQSDAQEPAAPAATPAMSQPVDSALTTTHMQALVLLQQGRLDSAWARFDQLPEALADKKHALLEPLDRLAVGFEQAKRYDRARAVYERMAEIDANYRDVKPRLVRARGLALNVASSNSGLKPNTAPRIAPLSQLGRFLIEREIGRGAMGAIYLGRDPNLDRPVAIKTLALSKEFEGPDLEEARVRFFREAQMAGHLQHPDIVSIFDSGEQDGLAFIAMEYVEGQDLSTFTPSDHWLPVADVVSIIARAADALSYAHSRGVTHRDVKPANIMINKAAGTVKIMDFGVARLSDSSRTRTGMVLGTPSFMSPEQLAGQRIDGRSDLYSLGVTLFQLLTGRLPFENKSMALLMRAIANEPAPDVRSLRPELPEDLANVVAISLEKRPEVRYGDGRQMAQDLRAVLSPAGASAHD